MESDIKDPRFLRLLAAAKAGAAGPQLETGNSYASGEYDVYDPVRAFYWVKLSAENGNTEAQVRLSDYCDRGFGCQPDPAAAFFWAERAALAGYLPAMERLARFFACGIGTAADHAAAARWELRALLLRAAAGEASALCGLGCFYRDGRAGLPADTAAALRFFEQAAAAGNKDAMLQLAAALEKGAGCGRDEAAAERWYASALGAGSPQAARLRGILALRPRSAAGETAAQTELGLLLGTADAQGLELLKCAAGKGDRKAAAALFYYFRPAPGEHSITSEAAGWLAKAAELGVEGAAAFARKEPAPSAPAGEQADIAAAMEKAAAAGDKAAAIALASLRSSPLASPSPKPTAELKGELPAPAGRYELRVIGGWLTLSAGGAASSFKLKEIKGLAHGSAVPAKGGGYCELWLELADGREKALLMSDGFSHETAAAYGELARALAAAAGLPVREVNLGADA
ncbi:MAG TPA: hypothetical protein DCZ92_07450 [Elusimicrobia bacterium]|nr:MAG: hypothetical protein A2016_03810 [Elusimicrobia bacterium GWF2_62_30]HBA60642.1 hypothetical protein [Elusimicrobiota bacterium]